MAKDRRPAGTGGTKKRHSLSREIREEANPEWKELFERIARLRKEKDNPRTKRLIFSKVDKEGDSRIVVRQQSEPRAIKTFLKQDAKKAGRNLPFDLECIQTAWKHAVGPDIGANSSLYSFKNGILTMDIHSSALLQEIRQFHQEAIFKDLFDIWPGPMPLIKIIYRQGKR